jgi:predicted NBD/HSP70 family sugar kinase
MTTSLLRVKAKKPLAYDPDYAPAILGNRRYRQSVRASAAREKMVAALTRKDGAVARMDFEVHPPDSGYDRETLKYLERQIKLLIWAKGGEKLYLSGPLEYCESITKIFSPTGTRAYDVNRMGVIYDRALEVLTVKKEAMPEQKEVQMSLGGYLDGCRIGFDLGASDYKLAAVIDGKAVFTTEIPWNPSIQSDPVYHYQHIHDGLKLAAEHLPRVDAIGGSAAGAYVDNWVKYASLFRSVPKKEFKEHIHPLFLNLQKEWNVPFNVLNDGEVTALAGSMSLGKNALLGIAMGSSEATGYINQNGLFTGDYNELSYVPLDYNPNAALEPFSGDSGCGALYFSQQAVNRLAPRAGFTFQDDMPLPERLKMVQAEADQANEKALGIFETIGVYLGYTLPHYHEVFDFDNLLILGRVTSGCGGEVLIEKAKEVLREEFPELAERVALHVPNEKSRRVGQAVAAASLPKIPR